jgi:hypothetical protein
MMSHTRATVFRFREGWRPMLFSDLGGRQAVEICDEMLMRDRNGRNSFDGIMGPAQEQRAKADELAAQAASDAGVPFEPYLGVQMQKRFREYFQNGGHDGGGVSLTCLWPYVVDDDWLIIRSERGT